MRKAQHTPGPWEIDEFHNIQTPDGQLLLGGVVTPMTAGSSMQTAHVNASRIVAAVNACEGISTKALEDGVVKELLEALEYYTEAKCSVVDGDQIIGIDDGDLARAALAKAKGE